MGCCDRRDERAAGAGHTPPPSRRRLEIVVLPVSDVERAKEFYGRLGWRLDADFANGEDFRVIQFTPPGSGCSVIFGKNVTAAKAVRATKSLRHECAPDRQRDG
jgi:catechol 2,3-dioxygenase-like lactoylglutathione lyase family enzyme